MRFFDFLTPKRRVVVAADERAVITRDGTVVDVLGPGTHSIVHTDTATRVRLEDPIVPLVEARRLFVTNPDLAKRHFQLVEMGPHEIAVANRHQAFSHVLLPREQVVFLADALDLTIDRIDITASRMLPTDVRDRFLQGATPHEFRRIDVPAGHVAVVFDGDAPPMVMQPGTEFFVRTGAIFHMRTMTMRQQAMEVTGQEILTRDRVSVRVNVTVAFVVEDPVRVVTTTEGVNEVLRTAVQLAARETLGAVTLDGLLEDKVAINREAADRVRAEMAEFGIKVTTLALKDVILPGEMREILTSVVAAQKEAEANVIRRREETNATRSLLNTAKVMADNPVLLRLKELEALQAIADRVDTITVHNGTEGLMTDLVRLRDR
ncbi:slipin family protein [Aestuariivita boseongensis]|uniref:slipin family protein n=1 Tax=Aestuariivita boseongensis TaxID=1470562 RepID=UPI000683253F|nr:slipin family protein [Aestuariivita boseongensis]